MFRATLINCQNKLPNRWLLSGILFFFLVAIFLRLYRLDGPGLWGNEPFTFWLTSSGTLAEMLEEISWEKTNPRLHYIAIWAWFKTFGVSVWVGRSLSVLAGVLGVAAMYFLGRRLFNRETGLYAMALCAMCYYHLAISQETRPYALAFLFSVLSFLFFIAVLQEMKWRHLTGHVIFSALLAHTHHFGLLVLGAQVLLFALHCGLNRQQMDRKIFLFAGMSAFLVLLACLPLYSILSGAVSLRSFWTSDTPLYSSFFSIIASYVHFFGSSFPLVTVVSLATIFGVLVAFSPVAIGRKHRFMVLCLLVWLAAVFGIPYLYSKLAVPLMHHRYFTVALPPLLLLAAWGLYLVGTKYALVALLIQASGITENMIFTKRYGAISPERIHTAYQISYPRDSRHRKQIFQKLASYDDPVYISDISGNDLPFYANIFNFSTDNIKGHEDFELHLQGRPKKFWVMEMSPKELGNSQFNEMEKRHGILDKGYQRGPELQYKRAVARQYLPVCADSSTVDK